VCVECLLGKQKKPILFKVTEFRTVKSSSRVRQKGGVTVTVTVSARAREDFFFNKPWS
jgi:hypothetical protein